MPNLWNPPPISTKQISKFAKRSSKEFIIDADPKQQNRDKWKIVVSEENDFFLRSAEGNYVGILHKRIF